MSSLNTASTPLSPSFLYPRDEGSGLGAVGGERRGDDAHRVRFADEVHVGEDDDGVIEAEDVQPQQTMSTPQSPPRAVIEDHRIDHCPYRSWCDECVEGFGCERAHGQVDDTHRIAMISMDYAFITRQGAIVSAGDEGGDEQLWSDPTALKLLIVKDTKSKAVFAHTVPRKGVDEKRFSVDMVVADVLWLGYSKVLLKSDNEPAIVKLLKESLATLKVSGVDQVGEEHSPPYDSQANGAVEAAVKQVKARIRTMKLCLWRRIGKRIPPRHPIMTWLAPHAASIVRYRVRGPDGQTPYEDPTQAIQRPVDLLW